MITGRILATTCTFVVCTAVLAATDEEMEEEAAAAGVAVAASMVVSLASPSPLLEPRLFAGDLTR